MNTLQSFRYTTTQNCRPAPAIATWAGCRRRWSRLRPSPASADHWQNRYWNGFRLHFPLRDHSNRRRLGRSPCSAVPSCPDRSDSGPGRCHLDSPRLQTQPPFSTNKDLEKSEILGRFNCLDSVVRRVQRNGIQGLKNGKEKWNYSWSRLSRTSFCHQNQYVIRKVRYKRSILHGKCTLVPQKCYVINESTL